jgi:hypothetical protein
MFSTVCAGLPISVVDRRSMAKSSPSFVQAQGIILEEPTTNQPNRLHHDGAAPRWLTMIGSSRYDRQSQLTQPDDHEPETRIGINANPSDQ